MRRLWKRLVCLFAGHHTIQRGEEFDGKFWYTEDFCVRCHLSSPRFPGAIFKAHHEAYQDYPTEWTDIF